MRIAREFFKALGTDILVLAACQDPEESKKVRQSFQLIRELYLKKERIFSRFDGGSELELLNGQLGKFRPVSKDLLSVAQSSLKYYAESQGLFDPRVIAVLESIGYKKNFSDNEFSVTDMGNQKWPPLAEDLEIKNQAVRFNRRMDFSGIAKGYITDAAADFLTSQGLKNFLVDSGGDIYASGRDEKGQKWKVGLEGFPEEKMLIEISGGALATSGITRRKWTSGGKKFHHLINPRNFKNFACDLKTVTVIGNDTIFADVWAKTLFLMGKEKGIEFSDKKNIQSLFLDSRGNLYLSRGAKKYLNQ